MEIVWLLSLPTKNTDRLEKLMTTLLRPFFVGPRLECIVLPAIRTINSTYVTGI
jgi:hypothetical protein